MARSKKRQNQEVNAGSMADIAFLLLIFFLVTTQIATNKGLTMVLPPERPPEDEPIKLNDRNILAIKVNSVNKILIEEELIDNPEDISQMVYDFVLNFGQPDQKIKSGKDFSDLSLFDELPAEMRRYINLNLRKPDSSDGPGEAIVSIQTDRGTSYERYIEVLDQVNAAYYNIYGERVGLTAEEFRKLNRNDPRQRALYQMGRKGINKSISLAEPTKYGN